MLLICGKYCQNAIQEKIRYVRKNYIVNWLALPPLSSLRAFSALAEAGSTVAAGEKLNVSHAAISQQIKSLETHLGVPMVDRSSRKLELTKAGLQLAKAVTSGFADIALICEALTGADADRPLHVSTTQLFATSWLMPRLGNFNARHPGIDLMINPSTKLVNPAPGGIDVGLRFGAGKWVGLQAEMLVPTNMVIAAAPSLVGDRQFHQAFELLEYPWLKEIDTNQAEDWLRSHGVSEGRSKSVIEVPGNLMLDGARAGQGVFQTALSSIEADVAAGRLRVLFRDEGNTGYFIVTHPGILRPPARVFVNWLRRQI